MIYKNILPRLKAVMKPYKIVNGNNYLPTLKRMLNVKKLDITYGTNGKPYIANSNKYFSISHANNLTIIIYNAFYVIFTALLTLTREIRLFNLSDSYIIDKNNQSEFFAIREGILNCGRIMSYSLLLLAGITKSQVILNVIMVILTLSILIMGINIRKIDKFEK